MENFFTRYRNFSLLVIVVLAQIVGLAMQVKRNGEVGGTRLLRSWVVTGITPLENALVGTSQGIRNVWHNYFYLRGVRHENRELKVQLDQLRIEQVRLSEDAAQARRLQALLGFKEQYVSQTVAAQVIGTSGSDQSHVIYLDKGANDGIKPDMAVITPDGIVGKVLRVFYNSSQVLVINDPSSGVGAILEKSRLQGILQGTAAGEVVLRYVMSEEKVEPGERILTSGGDRIFPKGMPIGTVTVATPGTDLFLNVRVKPLANLNGLEEVLVVTKIVDKTPDVQQANGQIRASDILAQRLPSVPAKDAKGAKSTEATGTTTAGAQSTAVSTTQAGTAGAVKPASAVPAQAPGTSAAASSGLPSKPATPKPPASSNPQAAGSAQTPGAAPAVVKPASVKPKQSNDGDKPRTPDPAVPPAKPATPPASNQEIAR